jgi:hypothetical protein
MPQTDIGPDEDLAAFEDRLRAMYSRGQITIDDYFDGYSRENTKLYLSRDNPRAQSGHGSDIRTWRNVRSMILEPIVSDGRFIDVGSANGHLIESLDAWMHNTGVAVDFYGLELSQGLHQLALCRLPHFASRLFCGNALSWKPPFRFEYVYTMILGDIPAELHRDFLRRLLDDYVAPGGRLILGPWNDHGPEREIAAMGFLPTGYCEKTMAGDRHRIKRIVWIDK